MAGNKRISGVAVPITASIDPKSYEAISQLNKLFGGIQEDQIKNLAAKNPEIAKLLKAPYEQFMLDATKAIKTVDTVLAKGGTPTDKNFNHLVGMTNLMKQFGEQALALKGMTTIRVASVLGLDEALPLAKQLSQEMRNLNLASAIGGPLTKANVENFRKRIFDHSAQDMNEANNRRLAAGDPIAQYQADMARQNAQAATAPHARIPTGQRVHAGLPTTATGTSSPESDAAFRQRYELRPNGNSGNPITDREFRENTALREALHTNYGRADTERYGRFSRQSSHATRFAAQNIGFGVDDAIQSYHYGGIGGSIRAASNNATAIAGMLIPNPAAAAASVVGISIASALAPTLISMSQGTSGRVATDDRKIYEAGIHSQPAYDLAIKKGEGRSLARSSQNDLLSARVAATTAEKEAAEADKQWKVKARELTATVQGSGLVGQWGMALQHITGTGMTGELTALQGQKNDTIQKRLEARKQQDNAEAQYAKSLELVAVEREDSVLANRHNRDISNTLAQGGFANGVAMAAEVEKSFAEKIRRVNAGKGDKDSKQFRIRNLQMDRDDALADPEEMDRTAKIAFNLARQANRNFTERFGGDTSKYGAVLAGTRDQLEANTRDRLSGHISVAEEARRDALVRKNFERTGSRASEDDLNDINPDKYNQRAAYFTRLREDIAFREPNQQAAQLAMLDRSERRFKQDEINAINPETNPYKNMQRFVERQQEDIAAKNLNPADREAQTRAMLIAAEKRNEAMIPQARSFISRSTVGSMEDEELRARMVGNFGPQRFRDKHEGQTTEVMEGLLRQLVDELKLKGETIGS